MANGQPSDDAEEFVLRSGPRSGLKREFAFALKVHSEVSGSLGRTRSRKALNSPSCNGFSPDPSSKRIKASAADESAVEEQKKKDLEGIQVREDEGLGSGIESVKSGSEEIQNKNEGLGSGAEPLKHDAEEIKIGNEVTGSVTEQGKSNSEETLLGREEGLGSSVEQKVNNSEEVDMGKDGSGSGIEQEKSNSEEVQTEKEGLGSRIELRKIDSEEMQMEKEGLGSRVETVKINSEEIEIREGSLSRVEPNNIDLEQVQTMKEGMGSGIDLKDSGSEEIHIRVEGFSPQNEPSKSYSEVIQMKEEGAGSGIRSNKSGLEEIEIKKAVSKPEKIDLEENPTKKGEVSGYFRRSRFRKAVDSPSCNGFSDNAVTKELKKEEVSISVRQTRSGKVLNSPSRNGFSVDMSMKGTKMSSADNDMAEELKNSSSKEIKIESECSGIKLKGSDLEEIRTEEEGSVSEPAKIEMEGSLTKKEEVPILLSQTHSRKVQISSNEFSASLSNKRIKTSAEDVTAANESVSDLEESHIGTEGPRIEPKNSNVEETQIDKEGSRIDPKNSDLEESQIDKEGSVNELKGDSDEILTNRDGSGVESAIVIDDCDRTEMDGNAGKSPPPLHPSGRRFTRSALKCSQEQSISTVTMASSRSVVSEDVTDGKACKSDTTNLGDLDTDNNPSCLGTPQNSKLELKMSKKISLTKLPSTMKDLLATGLLEGLPVKYVFRKVDKKDLQGIIKDEGILCSCSSCKGSKVVSLLEFENHAGSLNKYPQMYIHLENGRSLRDILLACKRAPLDMVESTIQGIISSSSVNKDLICQNCKETFCSSSIWKSDSVCNKCLKLYQSEEIPTCEMGTSERLSKLHMKPKSADSTATTPSKSVSSESTTKPTLRPRSSFGIAMTPSKPRSSETSDKQHSYSFGIAMTPSQPQSADTSDKQHSSQKNHVHGRLTKKDLRLHKLVFMDDVLPDGTEVAYYARGQRVLEGYKIGNLIFCRCCNTEVSPSQFEAHAGWASRRKPYLHIYTSNGVSLHELSLSLQKGRKHSANDNDDLCTICADGGNLLLCDGCPRAFHTDCVGVPSVPHDSWYCKYCETMYDKEKSAAHNADALAAGRVLGVDPIEQISKRCIRMVRIVKPTECDVTVCVLCRCHDFSKSKFGPRTVLLCDQCEKEYHVGCLKEHNMGDLKELPKGKWFCSVDCNKIHTALEKLILRGSEQLPKSLSEVIRQKHEEISDGSELDVRWRILSGRLASPDNRLLLSKAVAIFQDCFDPIVDSATGRDLIPSMVYGRNIRDQEFGGMYCAVLIVNSTVVSAGILRIFGQEFAEIPLVATSSKDQGKGYFQSLFACIERFLGFLNVRNLLLPAADEAESIWTKKFGFKKINPDQLAKFTRDSHMMIFQGTSMLQKLVPKCRIINRPTGSSS